MSKKLLSSMLAWAILATAFENGFAAEALWPFDRLPIDQIKKDWGFEPDAKWLSHVQHACLRVREKSGEGGGSGVLVSPDGLLITNRHVIARALRAASDEKRNLARDGFYAHNKAEELDIGIEIHVLRKVLNVSESVNQELADAKQQMNEDTAGLRVKQHIFTLERNYSKDGKNITIVPYFDGAEHWLCVYDAYPAKLVFVPDEALSKFGGDVDDFRYPRHQVDVAFLRAYRGNEPLKTLDYFPVSTLGAKESELVFCAGNPGHTTRYLTVAQLELLRDHELPIQSALNQAQMDALKPFLKPESNDYNSAANVFEMVESQYKLTSGALDYFKTSGFIEQRKAAEAQWRKDIAASPDAAEIAGGAFGEVAAACKQIGTHAVATQCAGLPSTRFFSLASSLITYQNATRGKPAAQVQRIATSFKEYIDHVLSATEPVSVDIERAVLTAWLQTAQANMPANDPFIALALGGKTPAEAAERLLKGAEKLASLESLKALLDQGAEGFDSAKIPLLDFLAAVEQETGRSRHARREEQRMITKSTSNIHRALGMVRGKSLAPDASYTLRLGWGKICGYTEDNKAVEWRTTFKGMLARADEMQGKKPFDLSTRFLAARDKLDLNTPLDFVSTADGAPGSSGEPIFTKDLELVGVMFDGNRQEVPSIYGYIPPETGGRSIAVHTASIWLTLEKIYDAKELLEELKAAKK